MFRTPCEDFQPGMLRRPLRMFGQQQPNQIVQSIPNNNTLLPERT
jgi:hypothetical protein